MEMCTVQIGTVYDIHCYKLSQNLIDRLEVPNFTGTLTRFLVFTLFSLLQAAVELKKKRTFRKFTYRGVDLDQLLDMNNEQLMELFPCRVRRKISRGLKRKPMALIKKLRKKKKECPINEKPDVVKTHLRDMIIVPEMTGSVVGVYNGKTFNQVEIKVRICCLKSSIFI